MMNIMIVDDERTAINNLVRILRKLVPQASIDKVEEAEEALSICRTKKPDVIFLDINMPDMDGLAMAKEINRLQPQTNIVMVTAYEEYALDAMKLYVSDYILKPAITGDVRNALIHLRNPIHEFRKGLYVQCFGSFAVFFDGEPVRFSRAKIKELFAYLIDRRGAECTNSELRAVLWRDSVKDDEKQRKYFAQIVYEFRSLLEELGCSEVFSQRRDAYAIVPDKIHCDYYEALKGDKEVLIHYEGEYMSQYEWSEERIGIISERLHRKKESEIL
ncbi:MAG: response regulator [Lachnospiraceae bacterium]|nr:response regulator [Lachnospiraceae bacterium]